MKTIAAALSRLLAWLAEREPVTQQTASSRDWADLPTFHPCT